MKYNYFSQYMYITKKISFLEDSGSFCVPFCFLVISLWFVRIPSNNEYFSTKVEGKENNGVIYKIIRNRKVTIVKYFQDRSFLRRGYFADWHRLSEKEEIP